MRTDAVQSALKLLALNADDEDSDSDDDVGTLEDELSKYLACKKASKSIGILEWWQVCSFPHRIRVYFVICFW